MYLDREFVHTQASAAHTQPASPPSTEQQANLKELERGGAVRITGSVPHYLKHSSTEDQFYKVGDSFFLYPLGLVRTLFLGVL